MTGRVLYNLGRISTYASLGVVFGLMGRSLALFGAQRWLSLGAGLMLMIGLLASTRWGLSIPALTAVHWLKRMLGQLLQRRSMSSLYLFGLLNGLLPCGLVYAAGAGAVAAGSVGGAVSYMAVFGLGTTPLMLGLALSRNSLPQSLRVRLQKLIPVSLLLVASLLIVRGLALGIPYLSPALDAAGQAAKCH